MVIEILICHAREDERLLLELERHLKLLERTGLVIIYHEGKIRAGDHGKQVINMHMQRAHIILLLLSRDFVASDSYVEIEQALQQPGQISGQIIPIILRAIDWQASSLRNLQVLPHNSVPVKNWPDRDHAWTIIVQHIREIAVDLDCSCSCISAGMQERVCTCNNYP